jgi:hypothetical protein
MMRRDRKMGDKKKIFSNSQREIKRLSDKEDRLCGLVVRVPGYTAEMYCVSCEVQTEFIYVM